MKRIALLLIAAACAGHAPAQDASDIHFSSVGAALKELKAKPGVQVSVQDGWTTIEDKAGDAVWSFAPQGHPGYPAVIKRSVVVRNGKPEIDLRIQCQARKAACDKLLAEFAASHTLGKDVRSRTEPGNSDSQIDVQNLGGDAYRLVLTSKRSKTSSAGQQELLPKAQALCGAKNAVFGRFQFEQDEALKHDGESTLILKQDIVCSSEADGRTPGQPPAPANTEMSASVAQQEAVRLRTQAYFAAKDQAHYQDAYAMLGDGSRSLTTFERWQARVAAFNAKAGAVRERRIAKVTWYLNPPGVDAGRYVAVDFVSRFAKLDVHCGYVVWNEQSDGSYLLVREEENSLDLATASKIKAADLDQVRAKLGCKG
ncbi:MAG: DUF4019 domain-containing protein [Massilia sp.]